MNIFSPFLNFSSRVNFLSKFVRIILYSNVNENWSYCGSSYEHADYPTDTEKSRALAGSHHFQTLDIDTVVNQEFHKILVEYQDNLIGNKKCTFEFIESQVEDIFGRVFDFQVNF